VKSAELVATVSQLHDLVPTIRNHHENWDGSGYPDHLAGAAIPYWARIITIADTIDAMTTDRPYRKALSVETVRTEIASMAGRQFDPSICVALLNNRFFDKLEEQLSPPLRSGSNLRLEPTRSRYSA
jgi:HD-GYP domain-containing protein (c-di-GMP phosphodiesterase class II)